MLTSLHMSRGVATLWLPVTQCCNAISNEEVIVCTYVEL